MARSSDKNILQQLRDCLKSRKSTEAKSRGAFVSLDGVDMSTRGAQTHGQESNGVSGASHVSGSESARQTGKYARLEKDVLDEEPIVASTTGKKSFVIGPSGKRIPILVRDDPEDAPLVDDDNDEEREREKQEKTRERQKIIEEDKKSSETSKLSPAAAPTPTGKVTPITEPHEAVYLASQLLLTANRSTTPVSALSDRERQFLNSLPDTSLEHKDEDKDKKVDAVPDTKTLEADENKKFLDLLRTCIFVILATDTSNRKLLSDEKVDGIDCQFHEDDNLPKIMFAAYGKPAHEQTCHEFKLKDIFKAGGETVAKGMIASFIKLCRPEEIIQFDEASRVVKVNINASELDCRTRKALRTIQAPQKEKADFQNLLKACVSAVTDGEVKDKDHTQEIDTKHTLHSVHRNVPASHSYLFSEIAEQKQLEAFAKKIKAGKAIQIDAKQGKVVVTMTANDLKANTLAVLPKPKSEAGAAPSKKWFSRSRV